MRNGFLGAIMALATGAGLAWGQYPSSGSFGAPSVIPPQLPSFPGGGPSQNDPAAMPNYPTPNNLDAFNPNGPASGQEANIPRIWLTGEYMLFFSKSAHINAPLVTTSAPADGGVVGSPSTQVLFGNQSVPFGVNSGYRFDGGYWFDNAARLGIDLGGFYLEPKSKNFGIASLDSGTPVIARPFFDPQTGTAGSFVVSSPGIATGNVFVATRTQTYGGEANAILNLYRSAPQSNMGYSLSVAGGLRYLKFSDDVEILTNSNLSTGGVASINNQTFVGGTTTNTVVTTTGIFPLITTTTTTTTNTSTVNTQIVDHFRARNEFYGGNLGLFQYFNYGRWNVGLTTKLALGDMQQLIDISGVSNVAIQNTQVINTAINPPGAFNTINSSTTSSTTSNNVASGGILATSNIIGHKRRDDFAAIPEVNLKIGYEITPAVTIFGGYSMTYISRVVRSGDLISGNSSPALQPTNAAFGTPSVVNQQNLLPRSDFWIQGLTFGLNIRY